MKINWSCSCGASGYVKRVGTLLGKTADAMIEQHKSMSPNCHRATLTLYLKDFEPQIRPAPEVEQPN